MSLQANIIVDHNGKLLAIDNIAEALFGFDNGQPICMADIFIDDDKSIASKAIEGSSQIVRLRNNGAEAKIRCVPVRSGDRQWHILNVQTTDKDQENDPCLPDVISGSVAVVESPVAVPPVALAEYSPYGMVLLSDDFELIDANPAFYNITSIESVEAAGRGWLSVLQIDESQRLAGLLASIAPGSESVIELEALLYNSLVTPHWVMISGRRIEDASGTSCYVVTFEDIDRRKRSDVHIQEMATIDSLTGLPNRREFENTLTECISETHSKRSILAVLFIDIDGFKQVNDSFGHEAGDQLLKKIAGILEKGSSRATKVARLGGDEFTVLLTDIKRTEEVKHFVSRLTILLQQTVEQNGVELEVSASIGIAMHHKLVDDRRSAERIVNDLLRHADDAMYAAKNAGKNCYKFYGGDNTSRTNTPSLQKADKLLNDINRAMRNLELHVAYQPQVVTASGNVFSCEALLRWDHKVDGAISPSDFVPLVESNGNMGALTIWLIEKICQDYKNTLSDFYHQGNANAQLSVSVNLSPAQLQDHKILANIHDIICSHQLDSSHFLFEITERTLISDPRTCRSSIGWLRDRGYKVALDDFGTGYSSLAYLHQFPLDEIKLDGSFIKDVQTSEASRTVVKSVVDMAHALNLSVTAEGVETEAHLKYVRETGCDHWQGFLMSPAVDAVSFLSLIDTSKKQFKAVELCR